MSSLDTNQPEVADAPVENFGQAISPLEAILKGKGIEKNGHHFVNWMLDTLFPRLIVTPEGIRELIEGTIDARGFSMIRAFLGSRGLSPEVIFDVDCLLVYRNRDVFRSISTTPEKQLNEMYGRGRLLAAERVAMERNRINGDEIPFSVDQIQEY